MAASLARLGLARLDLVQCHDIEFGDLDQVVTGALPALADLKAQGVVGAVGVTGLGRAASCCSRRSQRSMSSLSLRWEAESWEASSACAC